MQSKGRVCLACSSGFLVLFFNPSRTDQKVLLLPETDAASTNPTLIFHVLTFDYFGGGGGLVGEMMVDS